MAIPKRIRYFNKRFTNRVMIKIAGKARSPIALLKHVGRKSGNKYSIPLIAERNPNGFVFALTYGPEVDWYKNVLAAGSCSLVWKGQEYYLVRPQKLDQEAGTKAFAKPKGFILKQLGITDFFEMEISENGEK